MSGRKIARRDFVAGAATAPLALGALGALGCSGGDGNNGRDAGRGPVAAPGEQDRLAQILDQAVVVGPVPIASPISFQRSKASGGHQRSTGRWRADGRRYCPMVTMSVPAECRSARVCTTSSWDSPMPAMIDDLVVRPAPAALASTDRLRA